MINLLPSSEQELLRKERIFSRLRAWIIASLLSYALAVVTLIVARIYMESDLSSLDSQIRTQTKIISEKNNAALKKRVENYNGLVADYVKLQTSTPRWSKILIVLSALTPSDVQITNFSANLASGKLDISGKSRTRDSVLLLRSNIASNPNFKNIDLPLENLQKPANLDFHYSFFFSDPNVLLQKK